MLNKNEILERTNNGLDVFKYYLPGDWILGRNFRNPFYDDKKASCNVYLDKSHSCYRIKDFGDDTFTGDCFFLVAKVKNLDCNNPKDFVEVLRTINNDLSLGLSEVDDDSSSTLQVVRAVAKKVKPVSKSGRVTEAQKGKPFEYDIQSFSAKELAFWAPYGITAKTLKTYNVFSLKEYRSEKDGKPYTLQSSEQEPIFGYMGGKHVKIYRPFSSLRFLHGGDPGENYCFGLKQLPARGDSLFITGGEKDVMTLAAHGFYAICFNSETSNISRDMIQTLSYRFKHIFLLYDVDEAGINASIRHEQKLTDFNIRRFVLPLSGEKGSKDISDFFKNGNTLECFNKLFLDFF
jgi:hypothetical protein